MTAQDDIDGLLARVAAQDRRAFRSLYAAAAPKLFGVLMRMLRDRTEAEDALQDVFTRIWLQAGRFDPGRGRAMSWLVTVARNQAIDRLRTRPRAPHDGDDAVAALADPAPGPETRLEAEGAARRIAACLGELETDRAGAVQGAYLQGLSYQDLADRYGVPLNTMRTWLRRSLMKLKDCLAR